MDTRIRPFFVFLISKLTLERKGKKQGEKKGRISVNGSGTL